MSPVIFFSQSCPEKYLPCAAENDFIYKDLSHGCEDEGVIVEVGNLLCSHPCD